MIEIIMTAVCLALIILTAKMALDIRRLNNKIWPPDEPTEIS